MIEMLSQFFRERANKINIIYAEYNIHHNSIDIATTAGYLLRIDCWEAEKGLKTTPNSECALNALAVDDPLEYARLYLDGNMQMWVDAEDSLELWYFFKRLSLSLLSFRSSLISVSNVEMTLTVRRSRNFFPL